MNILLTVLHFIDFHESVIQIYNNKLFKMSVLYKVKSMKLHKKIKEKELGRP